MDTSAGPGSESRKATILVALLDVDGPDYISVKRGPHAGSQVARLTWTVGEESGLVSKVTAWRETAETWGGLERDTEGKRGDIVLLESTLEGPF